MEPTMLSSIAIYKQNHVCPLSQQRKDPNQYFVLGSAICKEALQIAEKRETKGKGEKEKYTHLNAEFQKIARSNKKAFVSEHCKEIEKNNRVGKTRDLLKKIRDNKGTLHVKMGTIKGRNGMDLAEAEGIKKMWQEYTEELYKKRFS